MYIYIYIYIYIYRVGGAEAGQAGADHDDLTWVVLLV